MSFYSAFTQVLNAFSYLYLCYIFYALFFKRKSSIVATVVYFFLATCACACSLVFLRGTIWNFLAIIVIGFTMTFLFECKLIYKLLFWALIYGIQTTCESTVSSLMSAYLGTYLAINGGQLFFIGMMFSKVLIFLVILIIRMKKRRGMGVYLKKSNIGLLLLPLGTLVTYTFQAITAFENPDLSKIGWILNVLSCIILGFSNIVLFDFIDSLYKNAVNESRMGAALELIEAQKEQYKTMLEHNRDIMKIEHDNKNFCIGLIADMQAQRYDEVVEKLRESQSLSIEREMLSSSIVSFIADIKRKTVEDSGIKINCEHSAGDFGISATDMAIVLGNAIDNAIEACRKIKSEGEKIIEVIVKQKNGNVIIVVKNPIDSKIDVGKLETKKENSRYHGFGIISMNQIAEKYNGEVMFSCEDGVFTTSIIMNNIKIDE